MTTTADRLVMTAVGGPRDGETLDVITLDPQGTLTYQTGLARDYMEMWRRRKRTDDAGVFAIMLDGGWSDSYVDIAPGTAVQAASSGRG